MGSLVLLLIAAVAIWFLFLDAPDAVSIDDATAQLADEPASDSPADAPTEAGVDGIEGIWMVDTSIGEFGFDDTTGSFVGFRVDEEFSDIGEVTAVGRTPAVSGRLEIVDDAVVAVAIEAEVGEFVTDDKRRDTSVIGTLDALNFPTATFALTEPIDLPADAETVAFSVDAVGNLTIKGRTNPVVFVLDAQLVDDVIAVVGSTEIAFADYDVDPPSVEPPTSPIVIIVEDHGIIEFQLFFTRTG